MDKDFKMQPLMENGEIKLGYEERGVGREIFALLLKSGIKHEIASHILTVVDDLYQTSDKLHRAFDLDYRTAISKARKIGDDNLSKATTIQISRD